MLVSGEGECRGLVQTQEMELWLLKMSKVNEHEQLHTWVAIQNIYFIRHGTGMGRIRVNAGKSEILKPGVSNHIWDLRLEGLLQRKIENQLSQWEETKTTYYDKIETLTILQFAKNSFLNVFYQTFGVRIDIKDYVGLRLQT